MNRIYFFLSMLQHALLLSSFFRIIESTAIPELNIQYIPFSGPISVVIYADNRTRNVLQHLALTRKLKYIRLKYERASMCYADFLGLDSRVFHTNFLQRNVIEHILKHYADGRTLNDLLFCMLVR